MKSDESTLLNFLHPVEIRFPAHKGSLSLTHNDHRSNSESVEQWIADNDERDFAQWRDEEAKQRAIATDELWMLQWYPDSPVGFLAVAAPTLAECLEFANTVAMKSKAGEIWK